MNWGLFAWVAGVMLTFAAIKFIFMLLKNLCSKENLNSVIDGIGSSCQETSKKMSDYLTKKVQVRREKKEAEKELNKPVIRIR